MAKPCGQAGFVVSKNGKLLLIAGLPLVTHDDVFVQIDDDDLEIPLSWEECEEFLKGLVLLRK